MNLIQKAIKKAKDFIDEMEQDIIEYVKEDRKE